jgi:hypothetical protein
VFHDGASVRSEYRDAKGSRLSNPKECRLSFVYIDFLNMCCVRLEYNHSTAVNTLYHNLLLLVKNIRVNDCLKCAEEKCRNLVTSSCHKQI